MKTYGTALYLATILGMMTTSIAYAGRLTVINNIPNQPIYLFIRGEGSNAYSTYSVEAGEQINLHVEEENVKGKPTFEVTASTTKGGDPDWKLMGGTCANLVTKADHTLVITSTLGKISCENKTADNPSTQN
jgi:hypothetical protein